MSGLSDILDVAIGLIFIFSLPDPYLGSGTVGNRICAPFQAFTQRRRKPA